MDKLLFSVVLPVYNVEKYLNECLDSLVNQTFKDFAVIAVNDGSTDASLRILEEYRDKNLLNMKIINQSNMGLSDARNSALKYLDGEYTYFLDSDDYLDHDTFEVLKENILKFHVDLIKFDAKPFLDDNFNYNYNELEYDTSKVYKESYVYNQDEFLKINIKKFMAPVWLYCVRTQIILDNNLNFKSKLIHEDELFTPLLFMKCTSYLYIKRTFFNRRYRENSLMTKEDSIQRSVNNYHTIYEELKKHMIKMQFNINKIKRKFIKSRMKSIIYIMHSLDLSNLYIDKNFNISMLTLNQKAKIFIKRKKFFK